MEPNQNQPLFGLNVDTQSKSFLAESAKWGRFLAILGFIVCILIVLGGIFMATQATQMESAFSEYGGSRRTFSGFGPAMGIVYVVVALIYFFPCLYLLRFSNYMKTALAAEDQSQLTLSFQNLKSMFKYVGIFTIVILSIYVVIIIVGIGAAARM